MREEEDVPTGTDWLGTDQYDSENSSDVFIGPAKGDFVRLQRDFYQCYGEHKELGQYIWETMHTIFPITSLMILSVNFLQEKMEKSLNQVSSKEDRWRGYIWVNLKLDEKILILNMRMKCREKKNLEQS